MAKPAFKFYLDTASDGTFATEITAYVLSADWSLGFAEAFELMGRDNTAILSCNNSDRRFSPEYTSGAYYGYLTTGLAVKITSTYLTVTRTMYVGWIASIAPRFNTKGDRTSDIECNGWFERALRYESRIPLQFETTADQVIATILDESDILPPGVTGRWILGRGLLGIGTTLGAISDYYTYDTGDAEIVYAGDWDIGTTVHEAVLSIVDREAGRFFQKRDGTLQFYRRLHFPADTLSLASFSDANTEMDYMYGADISNYVVVEYAPRSVGTAGSTLATLASSAAIAPASDTTIEYAFTSAIADVTVGATAIVVPVPTTDYTANTMEDGTGTDVTSYVTALVTEQTATAASVKYSSTYSATAYLQPTSKLRGTPLTKYNAQRYVAQDDTSLLAHGQIAYMAGGVQDTYAGAASLASYQLDLRKDAVGRVNAYTLAGYDTNRTVAALTRTIGDRITMHESQTQANGDWFIVSEQHSLNSDYRVTWKLEDAGTIIYWALGNTGASELGQTTWLGPL